MKNISRALTILSLLAGSAACGSDDNNKAPVDGGNPFFPVDSGLPDSGAPNMDGGSTGVDSGVVPASDSGTSTTTDAGTQTGTDCFSGTPATMEDFLNRCTTAQTANKPTLGIPAAELLPDGGVLSLSP